MTFKFVLTSALEKQITKLAIKDKVLALAIGKKLEQIINLDCSAIQHFKNLRGDLCDYKRVHVGSFVLMFKIEGDILLFDKLRHHDEAY